MPVTFSCEDEPNEFMEMPCRCDCGKWFDLNDGYRDHNSNKVVCGDCNTLNEKIKALRDEHYELECGDKPYKREKKKIISELAKLGAELDPY